MTDDEYVTAPSRQTGHLAVTLKGSRATLSLPAWRYLVAALPVEGVRVRWLLKRDGTGFALEATMERSGSYSLASRVLPMAPAVREWQAQTPDVRRWVLTPHGTRLAS